MVRTSAADEAFVEADLGMQSGTWEPNDRTIYHRSARREVKECHMTASSYVAAPVLDAIEHPCVSRPTAHPYLGDLTIEHRERRLPVLLVQTQWR